MRLVVRHVKVPDAEREIDRIEIFWRGGKNRQMRGQKDRGQRERGAAAARPNDLHQAGRRTSPSFRLPVR